jgi:Zn-dependent peptidase ImmA (M78 family)/DNA-binding XRE family transcriptional regulator
VVKGLSQEKVAESAGISRPTYVRIEAGESLPKVPTLIALAQTLGVQLNDLVAPASPLKAVRFRAQKKLTSREQILVNVSRWLKDYRELEDLLGKRENYEFQKFPLDCLPEGPQRAVSLAQRARVALNLREDEPIRDICGLLEASGIKIYPMEIASDAFFGLSVAPDELGPAIIVNNWERISVERRIFTAAHELGHLLLHLHGFQVEQTDEPPVEEEEANLFAGEFLMPQDGFDKEWRDTYGLPFVDRVLKVKRIFRVSYKTVLYRLWKGPYSYGDDIWQKFAVQYRQRYGKLGFKVEPQGLPPDQFTRTYPEAFRSGEPGTFLPFDFIGDRLSRLVRQAIEQDRITLSRGAEIMGVPLDEMREVQSLWA